MYTLDALCLIQGPVSVKISERNFTFLEKENEATVNNPNNLTSIKSNTFAVMQKKNDNDDNDNNNNPATMI